MDAEGINLLAELCSVSRRYQEAFRVGWVSGWVGEWVREWVSEWVSG